MQSKLISNNQFYLLVSSALNVGSGALRSDRHGPKSW